MFFRFRLPALPWLLVLQSIAIAAAGTPLFAAGDPRGITVRVYAIRDALTIAAGS